MKFYSKTIEVIFQIGFLRSLNFVGYRLSFSKLDWLFKFVFSIQLYLELFEVDLSYFDNQTFSFYRPD